MEGKRELVTALEKLGELLLHRRLQFELAIVGGAALVLQELISRATLDMDVVAMIEGEGRWVTSKPLPPELVSAVQDVAIALDLPRQPRDEKDWLNAGPAMLLRLGLPEGFEKRATVHHFGGLTLRVASREDLICLKLWSATDTARGVRRSVDAEDLQKLGPTRIELRNAVRWCAQKDGREDYTTVDALPVLRKLGFELKDIDDE